MNKTKLSFALVFLVCGVICANAQSGAASLRVFVHAGKIGNGEVRLENVKVILRPIEAWNKSKKSIAAESENDGYYSTEVSFGEYELIVSADNFQTYRANVYLPSSVNFIWGVRLHKLTRKIKKIKRLHARF